MIAVVVIGGVGCSSSGGGKPNPKNIDEKNLCDEIAKVACYNMWNCCTGSQIEQVLGVTLSTSESDCRDDAKLICEKNWAPLLQSVVDEKVIIDSDKAAECLRAMVVDDGSKCFTMPTDYQRLQTMNDCGDNSWIQGQVPAGGDCVYSFECDKDTTCEKESGVVGKCISLIGSGEECEYYFSRNSCKDGLYCASTVTETSGLACGIITASCACNTKKAENSMCCSTTECAEGLYCDKPNNVTNCSLTGTSGTCTAKKALGTPCYSKDDSSITCAEGLYCEIGVCSNDVNVICTEDSNCNDGDGTNICNGRVCAFSSASVTDFCTVGISVLVNDR